MSNINFVKYHENAVMPKQAHENDAGFDLFATENVYLSPSGRCWISTGIGIQLPVGYAGFVMSRSGLAKDGIFVLNAPGVVDCGYTGSIKVILANLNNVSYSLKQGSRIAQLIIMRVEQARFIEVDSLIETDRGINGFGSTGI